MVPGRRRAGWRRGMAARNSARNGLQDRLRRCFARLRNHAALARVGTGLPRPAARASNRWRRSAGARQEPEARCWQHAGLVGRRGVRVHEAARDRATALRAMAAKVFDHVSDRRPRFARRREHVSMEAIAEDLAALPRERAVHGSRDPHREPLHAAAQPRRVLGFDDQMQMVPLNRIVDDPKPRPVRARQQSAAHPTVQHAQRRYLGEHAHRRMDRPATVQRRPLVARHQRARSVRLPSCALPSPTPANLLSQRKTELRASRHAFVSTVFGDGCQHVSANSRFILQVILQNTHRKSSCKTVPHRSCLSSRPTSTQPALQSIPRQHSARPPAIPPTVRSHSSSPRPAPARSASARPLPPTARPP
jgi:hypothetical protein